MNPPENLGILC